MKFKELSIEDLKKEINNFLNTKTSDEIIDTLERYLYNGKLQMFNKEVIYCKNTEFENYVDTETVNYDINCDIKSKYKDINIEKDKYINFDEWECEAA